MKKALSIALGIVLGGIGLIALFYLILLVTAWI